MKQPVFEMKMFDVVEDENGPRNDGGFVLFTWDQNDEEWPLTVGYFSPADPECDVAEFELDGERQFSREEAELISLWLQDKLGNA